jgi:2'-5' RNA ligase
MKKFNLALLPCKAEGEAVNLAQRFATLSESYLLGKGSKPHVTLCQFYSEEEQVAEIWEKANQITSGKVLHLCFNQISDFHSEEGRIYIQLVPEPNEALQQWHEKIAHLIEAPLGRVFEAYFPHLTLATIQKARLEQAYAEMSQLKIKFKDDFRLGLGRCDEVGQVIELLYS